MKKLWFVALLVLLVVLAIAGRARDSVLPPVLVTYPILYRHISGGGQKTEIPRLVQSDSRIEMAVNCNFTNWPCTQPPADQYGNLFTVGDERTVNGVQQQYFTFYPPYSGKVLITLLTEKVCDSCQWNATVVVYH